MENGKLKIKNEGAKRRFRCVLCLLAKRVDYKYEK